MSRIVLKWKFQLRSYKPEMKILVSKLKTHISKYKENNQEVHLGEGLQFYIPSYFEEKCFCFNFLFQRKDKNIKLQHIKYFQRGKGQFGSYSTFKNTSLLQNLNEI